MSENDPTNNDDFLTSLKGNPLATVAAFYASCLSASAKAIEFIKDELKLTLEEATAQGYGFSDRTLGKQMPPAQVKVGRELRDSLKSIGLYKGNGRETLRGYVTEPIHDEAGNVVAIRGHKVDKHCQGPAVVVIGQSDDEPTTKETNDTKEQPAKTETQNDDELLVEENQITFTRDDRRYRIRGLEKNKSTCTLKVAMMVIREGLVHLDSLDLVKARSRSSFIKATATELFTDADTIKKDIGTLLLKLETLQAERIDAMKSTNVVDVKLTDNETDEALKLLKDPNLLERIVADMDACGIVGESTNKLAGYLAATSRKLAKPLAIVIQSSSSAGKTSLMDAILSMMPDEAQLRVSKLTGKSLYYLETSDIQHKTLAISEDEGIREAAYALKLLQSEGCLRHATVVKGEAGTMTTAHHTVYGPTQIFLTTTAMDLDEELMNRCLVLAVDETRSQTNAIQTSQRTARTVQSKCNREHVDSLRTLYHNAQRLLRSIEVNNPYAPQLTFADNRTRLRRDHEKYLTLIDTIALLHQHQREIKTYSKGGQPIEYINVQPSDIAVANGMAGEILGRSLDELSPQTRTLLMLVHNFVRELQKQQSLPQNAVRFTRRDLRESIGWSDFQIHKHLSRLVDLEYLVVHRGKQGRRFVYELLYDGRGREGQPFLSGLIDPAKLKTPVPMIATLSP
jgi:PAS domain-containing protein